MTDHIHQKYKVHEKVKLKRALGFWETTFAGVGVILGAGVYALVGKAAGLGGYATWMAFLFSAILAVLTGLGYAELSSILPQAGAEYAYTKKAFGKRLAFLVGWLIIIGGVFSSTAVSLGFAGYFAAIFSTPMVLTAMVFIAVISFVIFWGIKQSAWLAILFTAIEMGGLILIILLAAPNFGAVDYLAVPSWNGVFSAAALIFFAYIGFEGITRLSEETKAPTKTVPKALILSILITTVLYILVAVSAVTILTPAELASSASPLADVAAKAMGSGAFLALSVIALFSTANTVLLMLLATSRVTYGMGRGGSLPGFLGRVHKGRRTPWASILILGIVSIIVVSMGEIAFLAELANFTVFITFIVINGAMIALRYKIPGRRPFKVPVNIGRFPVISFLGLIASAFLLINLGVQTLLWGSVLVIIGYLLYVTLLREKNPKQLGTSEP